jgi:hypothetical protein
VSRGATSFTVPRTRLIFERVKGAQIGALQEDAQELTHLDPLVSAGSDLVANRCVAFLGICRREDGKPGLRACLTSYS